MTDDGAQDGADHQITRLLAEASGGKREAVNRLLPLVYDQLKAIALRRMASERDNHTLQATALVHEAYLRLVGNAEVPAAGRAQFFFAAAQAMRRVLVDHARSHGQLKRGGGRVRMPASVMEMVAADEPSTVLALDEALDRLEQASGSAAEVVRLRFFAGMTVEEAAEALGRSPRTVKREWTYARAFLAGELGGDEDGAPPESAAG